MGGGTRAPLLVAGLDHLALGGVGGRLPLPAGLGRSIAPVRGALGGLRGLTFGALMASVSIHSSCSSSSSSYQILEHLDGQLDQELYLFHIARGGGCGGSTGLRCDGGVLFRAAARSASLSALGSSWGS